MPKGQRSSGDRDPAEIEISLAEHRGNEAIFSVRDNGVGFDVASGNAFAANADGTLTVIHQDSPDQYHVTQNLQTVQGARNMGLDPANHRVFIVSAKFGPAPAGGAGNRGRGPVLPGSFTLMVVESDAAAR